MTPRAELATASAGGTGEGASGEAAAVLAGSWISSIGRHAFSVTVEIDGDEGEFVLHDARETIGPPARPRPVPATTPTR